MNENITWDAFRDIESGSIGYFALTGETCIVLLHDPDCPIYDDAELDPEDPHDKAIIDGDIWVALTLPLKRVVARTLEEADLRDAAFEHLRAGLVGLEEAKELAPTLL